MTVFVAPPSSQSLKRCVVGGREGKDLEKKPIAGGDGRLLHGGYRRRHTTFAPLRKPPFFSSFFSLFFSRATPQETQKPASWGLIHSESKSAGQWEWGEQLLERYGTTHTCGRKLHVRMALGAAVTSPASHPHYAKPIETSCSMFPRQARPGEGGGT